MRVDDKMKWQVRWFGLIIAALIIVSCEGMRVSTQATAPGEINPILESPSPTAAPLTVPQMTGTAEAIPTVVYPTETPLSPEELFDLSQWKSTSPKGNYVITCDYTYPTLFHAPTKTVIKTIRELSFRCENAVFWAPDESYAFLVAFDFDKTIYRLRTDGSQPEVVSINTEPSRGVDCDVKFLWSPDAKFLAVAKGCNLYSVEPDDESSFSEPLQITSCCFYSFQWATPRVLMVEYHWGYSFVQVPSGNWIGRLETSGGICPAQIPLISPDERWMVVDLPWCGGGEPGPNQFAMANLEDGSERVFSESFADQIDFVGWNKDSSEFYVVSRPAEAEALPDPRTPFGLLSLNPETLQIQNLFEQAWYVAFDQDFRWAYVVFPAGNDDGSLRLDGGLWQVGTHQMIGKQIMANKLEEQFFVPLTIANTGSMYSATGQELAYSARAVIRIVPATWSHDNTRVATINADHQLVIIDLQGETQTIAQLDEHQEWLYSVIKWSKDDQSIVVDDMTWIVP
jgi:WD40 repeat protein